MLTELCVLYFVYWANFIARRETSMTTGLCYFKYYILNNQAFIQGVYSNSSIFLTLTTKWFKFLLLFLQSYKLLLNTTQNPKMGQ